MAPQRTQTDLPESLRLLEEEGLLDKSDGDLRSILDHLPAMVGYWDRSLHNRFSNRAYHDWFGINPAHILGKHIREVIGEERFRLNLPYIEGVLRGEAQVFERTIPTPDNSRVRHSLAYYIPHVENNEVQGFYALVTETTVLQDALNALRASEERYRAVIEDQTELIARFAADGRFTFVNSVFCRFFNKPAEELIGQLWTPVCHPEDLADVEAHLRTLSPAWPMVVVEHRVLSSSGKVHWMQFVNRGFFDAAGRLLEVQSVGRDVTDPRNAEEALRLAHAQLEQRVVERTEQLRHLAIQTTLAEERERQAIARDLHDGLGQLLHIAKIKLELLAKQLPDSTRETGKELGSLLDDASRMARSLTTQLSPPVLDRLGLSHALYWLGDEMQRLYGLCVNVRADLSCPSLGTAQASILFRAARELLINVAKHSGVNRASLTLLVSEGLLTLTVEDAGIGIAQVAQALRNSSGFGLASIRERLTYLGGETEIFGQSGAGFRVTLRVPLQQAAPQDSQVSE